MSTGAAPQSVRLTAERIVREAIDLADESGLDGVTMRRLADRFGVTAMALYKHIRCREALVDAMIDTLVADARGPSPTSKNLDKDWVQAARTAIMRMRSGLSAHAWALTAIESCTSASPAVLDHMDDFIGIMDDAGLSTDLIHHAMHALSTRMWGFTREVFPTPRTPVDPAERAAMLAHYAERYPHIVAMTAAVAETNGGCDADTEFEFALGLLLNGIQEKHLTRWRPS